MDALTHIESSVSRANAHIAVFKGSATRALDAAIQAGREFIQQKEALPHGEWQAFFEEKYDISLRWARTWMNLAQHEDLLPKRKSTSVLGIEEAHEIIQEKLGKRPPPRELVDGEATEIEPEPPKRSGPPTAPPEPPPEPAPPPQSGPPTRPPEPDPGPPSRPPIVRDELGQVVPTVITEVFRCRSELVSVMTQISRVKGAIPDNPALTAAIDHQQYTNDLENARRQIQAGLPHCTCPHWPNCEDGCKLCRDRGWITKDTFGRLTPEQRACCEDRNEGQN